MDAALIRKGVRAPAHRFPSLFLLHSSYHGIPELRFSIVAAEGLHRHQLSLEVSVRKYAFSL